MEGLQAVITNIPAMPMQIAVVAAFYSVLLFTADPVKVMQSTLGAYLITSSAMGLPLDTVEIPAAANTGVVVLIIPQQGTDIRSRYYPLKNPDLRTLN